MYRRILSLISPSILAFGDNTDSYISGLRIQTIGRFAARTIKRI
jgi:hypothetical protein